VLLTDLEVIENANAAMRKAKEIKGCTVLRVGESLENGIVSIQDENIETIRGAFNREIAKLGNI
jgi:hypothetical protein